MNLLQGRYDQSVACLDEVGVNQYSVVIECPIGVSGRLDMRRASRS